MNWIIRLILAGLMMAGVSEKPAPGRSQDPADEDFDQARLAWDTGDFPEALKGFRELLNGPSGDRYIERIALITGELFQVREAAPAGRALRFSPDGKFGAYETGPRADPVTRLFSVDAPKKTVLEINGSGLVFSPRGDQAAFLRVPETPEIAAPRRGIEGLAAAASPDRPSMAAKQREWARLEARDAAIVLLDTATKKEKSFKPAGLLKSGLQFAADGRLIYFAGAPDSDENTNQIYGLAPTGEIRLVTAGPGFKTNPVAVPSGSFLIYTIATTTNFPRPDPSAKPAGSGLPPDDRPTAARAFALLDLVSQKTTTFSGSSPSVSADGSALVFLAREGMDTALSFVKLGGDLKPRVIKKTGERIGSAALAPDGSRVVFDMTCARNQEIFVIGADGKNETRVTREIENDRAPRFLAADRILAIKGEPPTAGPISMALRPEAPPASSTTTPCARSLPNTNGRPIRRGRSS